MTQPINPDPSTETKPASLPRSHHRAVAPELTPDEVAEQQRLEKMAYAFGRQGPSGLRKNPPRRSVWRNVLPRLLVVVLLIGIGVFVFNHWPKKTMTPSPSTDKQTIANLQNQLKTTQITAENSVAPVSQTPMIVTPPDWFVAMKVPDFFVSKPVSSVSPVSPPATPDQLVPTLPADKVVASDPFDPALYPDPKPVAGFVNSW